MQAKAAAAHSAATHDLGRRDREVPPQRREFKYLLPFDRMDHLRRFLEPHCEVDPYAGPDGSYLIRSLYLDTWDYRLYYANQREAPARYKARIRTYPSRPGSPVFLEIKGRVLDAILKTRAKVPRDGWQEYLRIPPPPTRDEEALTAFLIRFHQHSLQPTTLVQYQRFAFKGLREGYARVSVDVRIQCQEWHRLDLEADDRYWRPLDHPVMTITPKPISVLELKFSGPPPRWMHNLVQEMDLTRQAFSKYCYSMRTTMPVASHRGARRSP